MPSLTGSRARENGARVVGVVAVLALELDEAADRQPVERVQRRPGGWCRARAAVSRNAAASGVPGSIAGRERGLGPPAGRGPAGSGLPRPRTLARGGKPMPNSSTRTFAQRAVTKWPSSWISTSAPRIRMNRRTVTIDWAKPITRAALRRARSRTPPRTSASSAISASTSGAWSGPPPNRVTAASSRRGMPGKSSVPSRNRATATSSAAISAAEARLPMRPASRAMRSAGKRVSSGARKSSCAAATRSGGVAGDGRRSGCVRAYWMGSRMSGVPSWAFREPSTNRTAEWTTLCGCTTTSIASYSTSYSQCASMTSRPLFASVAESIVIFAPIVHVGWRRACSGRGRRRVDSASASRNGPPDAVSTRRAIAAAARRPGTARSPSAPSRSGGARRAAWRAGRRRRPPRRARRRGARASGITRCPPATSVSLFAVATILPARSAASTGRSDTTPPGAHDHEVDVVAGRERLERVGAADPRRPGRQVERPRRRRRG